MPLWGKVDNTANSALIVTGSVNLTSNSANRDAMYQNVTVGAVKNNGAAVKAAVGQFGVSPAEAANTSGEGKKVTHAGWNLRTAGTGSLTGSTILVAGSGYSNTDVVRVVSTGAGGANAVANVFTTGAGGISSIVFSNPGTFTIKNPTVLIANSTGGASAGTSANVAITIGGRAGRVSYETLVAMGSMDSGSADNALLP